ncbi:hypothetical protein K466DRAFT_162005 [Polyporus arcularius HHB13444]|uniref:Uncharacterized protein n=1 Tax=Polyporus arcularius HHB13444 TaxID=1314778 RepID=A0A5C3PB80_9APHY|nr:hypothetical protein K466DRAFT_162005 [Polyporus arcularius HHB13444]
MRVAVVATRAGAAAFAESRCSCWRRTGPAPVRDARWAGGRELTPTRLRGKDPLSENLAGRGRCLSPTRCRTEPRAASCSGRRGGPSADGAASRGWGRRQCHSSRARTRARRDWQEDLVNGGTQRRRVVYRKNTPNAPFSPQGPIQSPRRRRDPASVVRSSFIFPRQMQRSVREARPPARTPRSKIQIRTRRARKRAATRVLGRASPSCDPRVLVDTELAPGGRPARARRVSAADRTFAAKCLCSHRGRSSTCRRCPRPICDCRGPSSRVSAAGSPRVRRSGGRNSLCPRNEMKSRKYENPYMHAAGSRIANNTDPQWFTLADPAPRTAH